MIFLKEKMEIEKFRDIISFYKFSIYQHFGFFPNPNDNFFFLFDCDNCRIVEGNGFFIFSELPKKSYNEINEITITFKDILNLKENNKKSILVPCTFKSNKINFNQKKNFLFQIKEKIQ